MKGANVPPYLVSSGASATQATFTFLFVPQAYPSSTYTAFQERDTTNHLLSKKSVVYLNIVGRWC